MMSYARYQWRPIGFQAAGNRERTLQKVAVSIDLTYLRIERCLRSYGNFSDALQTLHDELIVHHCEFISGICRTSGDTRSNRKLYFHLSKQLWHVTRSCSDYLERYGSLEATQYFTHRTYQGFLLIYNCAAYDQCVWVESIANTAMTARRLGGSRFEKWDLLARMWCRAASDSNPNSGECLLSLAMLENAALRQLYYFSKSLLTLEALPPSSRQLMAGCPVYDGNLAEGLFIQAHRFLLMRVEITEFNRCLKKLQKAIDNDVCAWRLWHRSAMVACIMCAALLDFGSPESCGFQAMLDLTKWRHHRGHEVESHRMRQWDVCHQHARQELLPPIPFDLNPSRSLQTPKGVTPSAAKLFRLIARAALGARRYQFAYIVLSFIVGLSHSNRALTYLESALPWSDLVSCLNHISNEMKTLPPETSHGPLREDFMLHGYMWSWMLFPSNHFGLGHPNPDHMGDTILESIEVAFPLLQRCIQLAQAIVKIGRYLTFNMSIGYRVTEHAQSLEQSWARDAWTCKAD